VGRVIWGYGRLTWLIGLHGMSIDDVTKLHPLRRLSQPEEQAQ
jgi:hypothetical protein